MRSPTLLLLLVLSFLQRKDLTTKYLIQKQSQESNVRIEKCTTVFFLKRRKLPFYMFNLYCVN